MKNLFPFPRPFLLALAVAFVALLALSTHQLVRAGTASAFACLVIACTGMLAVLIVAALDQVVDVLKPLLEPRVGSSIAGTTSNLSPPLTHRQHLELGIAHEVVSAALKSGADSNTLGKKARSALDALVGRTEPLVLPDSFAPAAAGVVEALIQSAGLTAPRVTPEDLESNIVHTEIVTHVSPSGQILRWAVLTAKNGFAVTGRPSASVSAENDRPEIGKSVAIENAKNELWPLMGYELRTKLAA